MNRDELIEEIRYELRQLARLGVIAQEMLALPASERKAWDATAAAKFVADVFHGLENLWKRRCVYLKTPPPSGPDSHAHALAEFLAEPCLGGRLSVQTAQRLKLYKDFRHRFVHGYGFVPTWEIVKEPLELIPETVAELQAVWESWLSELP